MNFSPPLQTSLYGQCSLSLSLHSAKRNPLSLFTSLIYSLRLVECLWLCSDLTRVGRVWFNHTCQGICFIGNSGNGIGLVLASKRLVGSDTSQSNIELPRSWADSSKCIPDQVIPDWYELVYHVSKTKMGSPLDLGLMMFLEIVWVKAQGPRDLGSCPVQ